MTSKKWLLVVIFSLLLAGPRSVHAQSLPWVEIWVTVRDGYTGALIADAQVEIPQCVSLPADSCTRYGVWDGTRQVYLLKVPRLEPYDLVVSRNGYATQMRSGTANDPVILWDVRLYPIDSPMRPRVYLPIVIKSDNIPQPVYNPTAAVNRLNWWRGLAGAGAVAGNLELHSGCRAHARWMVNEQTAAHTEDPSLPGYTIEGDSCGQAANIAFGTDVFPSDEQAVDALMASPFHALAALDPRLAEVGFGSARLDMAWSGSYFGAALDVYHGIDWSRSGTFLTFPKNGGTLPILSYNGLAQPDPLTACPGYTAPTGPGLLAMFTQSAYIVSSTFQQGSTLLEHCVIQAGAYTNPNLNLMQQGNSALGSLGAVMVIPRQPLQAGKAYTVTLTYNNGQSLSWSFTTAAQPLSIVPLQVLLPNAD